ncbi:cell envelope integrity protein TolA [bacterium]|nr:cell envelope integrity protein TolA [bacterium]
MALAFGVLLVCAPVGSPAERGALRVDLPKQLRKPKLFALERGFGVIAAHSESQLVSKILWVSTREVALLSISEREGCLAAVPMASFHSREATARRWQPDCAAMQSAGRALVAYQKLLNLGVEVHTGSLKLDAGPSSAVQDETKVVGASDVSDPHGLSFVRDCGTGEWRGIVGIDTNSVMWVSLKGSGGAKAGKKRDVWRWIARGFAPQAALEGKKTLLLFYVEQERGGPISLLRCERKDDQWEKRNHLRVFPGLARRMALAAKGGALSLLVGETAQGRHEFHLLVSTDNGTTWRRTRRAHVALPGTLTDVALAHDGASLAGVLENAKGEATVFVLPLSEHQVPADAKAAKGDLEQEWKAQDRDRQAAEAEERRQAEAKARAEKLAERKAKDEARRRRYEEWKRRREAQKTAEEKPNEVTPQPPAPAPKAKQGGTAAPSAKGDPDAREK